jgi:excinuclease ABC subunit C
MDLHAKIRTIPTLPGCYLYKNAEGEVIYVGKAKNLRARVRSYFLAANQANAKTGTLMREAVDVDYITVANEHEALALENNLIKQRKPRFNILLRDDKTYPYIKLTLADRFPKVFVTRRLRKDGAAYFGPYFPGNLAHRLVDLIHRSFLIPSCKVDLSRYHPRACLQYYIKRCLGPCVEGLTTPETYRQAIRDVQLFLDGKPSELEASLTRRMEAAAAGEQFEAAARLRDQIVTVHQMQDKQRIAGAGNEDADVFGYHYENGMLAVNLFHMRAGKIVDRRDFFWEDLPELLSESLNEDEDLIEELAHMPSSRPQRSAVERPPHLIRAITDEPEAESIPTLEPNPTLTAPEITEDSPISDQISTLRSPTNNGQRTTDNAFSPAAFFASLLKQLYLDQSYVPRTVLIPVDFPDRAVLADLLTEKTGHRIEILTPQRGEKRSLVDLVCLNARQSFDQRFRVLAPAMKAIQEALQDVLTLEELPRRIECFDISHIQGAETVASMVVWEDGAMKKSDYRKFQVKTVTGVDDFASMREVIARRYKRLLEREKEDGKNHFPSLILVDGGLGQLHAAAEALAELGVQTQPLASIAKREEIIYVHGQESEPIVLDRRSPVLHLIQKVRDESHRFAVSYHRKRREMRDRDSELDAIPGVGPRTRQRLLEHFGSVRAVRHAGIDALKAVVSTPTAARIHRHFQATTPADTPTPLVNIS